MKCTIDPKIFETFPGVAIGVIFIENMDNRGHNDDILRLMRNQEARQKELLTGIELGSLPEIAGWRQIYKTFGSDPHNFRSSVESLLRRARGGSKPIPDINPLVNLYNYLSLKYHLPAGAEDLDKVEGDILLTFSDGTEKGIALGCDTEESPDIGEVIYKDAVGFLCRKWNWREADRTKIEATTKRAVLVLEKTSGISMELLSSVLSEAKTLLESHLKAKCTILILDEENNSILHSILHVVDFKA